MKVLVTGATGFLGGNVLKALKDEKDIEVIAACRNPEKLPDFFKGEIRAGDIIEPKYRKAVMKGIDVVCNTGSFGTFWGHENEERKYFYEPTRDLIDQALEQGVKRFIQTSTITLGPIAGRHEAPKADDFSLARNKTGFWPHVDFLMDLDRYMRQKSNQGMQMVTMRLGHFIGKGNTNGLLPMLLPRMKTHLVPWLDKGKMRLPLVTGEDMGEAFKLAALKDSLENYESFNISGPEYPTMRELFTFLAQETGLPSPHYNVSYRAAYAFGWLMEKMNKVLPGDPFLMRSIVFVSENWIPLTDYAQRKLGYVPKADWRQAVQEQIAEIKQKNYPWPRTEVPKSIGSLG